MTEQKYPDHVLLQYPELYRNNFDNALMKKKMFFQWVGLGIWHSICSFLPWLYVWNEGVETATTSGHSLFSLGAVVAGTSCAIINLKILIESKYWSIWLIISVFLSIVAYVVITLAYSAFYLESSILDTTDLFYTYIYMCDSRIVINILVTLISLILALLPDVIIVILCDMKMRLNQKKKTMPM